MFGWRTRRENAVEELVKEMMNSPDVEMNTFREVEINFVWVAIDGVDPIEIGKGAGLIADTAQESGWYVDYLFSNLVMLSDGRPTLPARIAKVELIVRLRQTLGQRIKLLHGARKVSWGAYGGSRRTSGPMFQDSLDLLCRLHAQPYGTEIEIAR